MFLLQDLINPKHKVSEDLWITYFVEDGAIVSLLNLFRPGVELVVKEVDSHSSSSYSLNITPYAKPALYFLFQLSNTPRGAEEFVKCDIFKSLSNNDLTIRLQEGSLDLFISFDYGSINEPNYVERNTLHIIWCQTLGVVNNLNRHLGSSREDVFDNTAIFMQMYSAQIDKALCNC